MSIWKTTELPDENRRECLVQLHALKGDYYLAKYIETIGKWSFVNSFPAESLHPFMIERWCYIDEIE